MTDVGRELLYGLTESGRWPGCLAKRLRLIGGSRRKSVRSARRRRKW